MAADFTNLERTADRVYASLNALCDDKTRNELAEIRNILGSIRHAHHMMSGGADVRETLTDLAVNLTLLRPGASIEPAAIPSSEAASGGADAIKPGVMFKTGNDKTTVYTVLDVLTTRTAGGAMVKIEYLCGHVFMGQYVKSRHGKTEIMRGLLSADEAEAVRGGAL